MNCDFIFRNTICLKDIQVLIHF